MVDGRKGFDLALPANSLDHFGSQAMTMLQSPASQELCMHKLKMTFESAEILDLWVAWLIVYVQLAEFQHALYIPEA